MPSPTEARDEIIQHIKDYLTGTSSLSTVASAIAEPIDRAYTAGEIQAPNPPYGQSTEGRLWTLWYSIIQLAKETSHTDSSAQAALVNLLAALKSRPNPPRPQNSSEMNWIWNGSGELWTDLVVFGPSMRESWNETPTGLNSHISVNEWTNLNAFVARVSAAGVRDFSLYAIWSMRGTLETEISAEKLDKLLPASVMWILYNGTQLYESKEEWPAGPTVGNPAGGGPLWSGNSGFCKERWILWKTRFEAIAQREDTTNEETKGFAADAVKAMDAIEHRS